MIPSNPIIDTNVIARAADGDYECMRALEVLAEHKVPLMIPAVVYAELARGEQHGGVGRLPRGIVPAAFDFDVGLVLAKHFPTVAMKSLGTKSEREAWDFDAMIYATAIAHGADALITHNLDDFSRLTECARDRGAIKVALLHPRAIVAAAGPQAKAGEQTTLLGYFFPDG